MKTITLAYGKGKIGIKIPAGVRFKVLDIKSLPPLRNFQRSLNQSLDKPIKILPFDRLFKSAKKVAIIIPDKTRRGYFPPILEVVVKRLSRLGIPNNQVTIFIARGIHPPHTESELRELVGPEVYGRFRIIDHDARNKDELSYIGRTSYGSDIWLNRAVVEADKIITCGVIQYHYFAGFSGGRKLIIPGVAGYETILDNHRLVFNLPLKGGLGKNTQASLGRLKDNPLHQDLIEGVDFLKQRGKKIFSIDLVLNDKRQPASIFAGDIRQAHEAGCRLVEKTHSVRLKKPVDCIITSTGGHPSDITFIQTHKTLEHVSKGLKEGGVLFALAECSQGIGTDSFIPWFRYDTPDEMEAALRKNYVVNGHTALCTLLKAQRFDVHLYTVLPPETVRQMQMTPVDNVQQSLDKVFKSLPSKHSVLVIPQGFNLVPRLC